MTGIQIRQYLMLFRPHQWYKNLIVFLALFFSENIMNPSLFTLSLLCFISFSLASSANYIINDIFDRKRDAFNPEKRNRPIASKAVGVRTAVIIAFASAGFSLFLSFQLDPLIPFILAGFILNTLLYSAWIKHIAYLEILVVSFNFVLRAIAGAIVINVAISNWLLLGTFFLALFVFIGKRKAEFCLGSVGKKARRVLQIYDLRMLNSLSTSFMTILIMSFALYAFSSEHPMLVWSTPLFVYLVILYHRHITVEDAVARHPHLIIKDRTFLIAIILFLILIFMLIYY